MITKLTTLFFLFSILSINAQVFEGTVAEFSEQYDMSEIESYSRINANGSFSYDRKGFISFKPDKIVFGVGKTNSKKEIYIELKFDFNITVFNELFGQLPIIMAKNEEGKQIKIEYYTLEVFKNMKGGQFVIYLKNKMYFLRMEKDVFGKVSDLYKK